MSSEIVPHDGTVDCGLDLYWFPRGHQRAMNTWEYYFEPVSSLSINFEFFAVRNIKHSLDYPRILVGDRRFIDNHRRKSYMNTHRDAVHETGDYATTEYRVLMNDVISGHVRLKPGIKDKMEKFHAAFMTGWKGVSVFVHRECSPRKPPASSIDELYEQIGGSRGDLGHPVREQA